MPEKKFALERGEPKRLRVVSGLFSSRYTIYFDGRVIGEIDNDKELKKGRAFTLPDGSKLNVRQKSTLGSTELQLFRNGVPLPESDADPQRRLEIAYATIYAVGIINIAGGILLLLTQTSLIGGLELDFFSVIVTGIIYLVLGFFVRRRSQIALGISVIGFVIDSVGILLLGVVGPGPIVARFFFLMPMIKGFSAIRALNNPPPLQNRDLAQEQANSSQFKSFLDEIADGPIPRTSTPTKKPVPTNKGMLANFTRLEIGLAAVVAVLAIVIIGVLIGTSLNKRSPVSVSVLPTQMAAPTLPPQWTPMTTATATLTLIATPTPASDLAPAVITDEQTPNIPLPETDRNSTDSITIQNDLQKIIFDTAGMMAYGLDYANRKVWFIDLVQHTVSGSLDLSGSPIDACVHPSQRRLYVVNSGMPTITEIDMDSRKMIRELTWPAPDESWDNEVRPFHIACQTDRLLLLDAAWAPKPWMIDLTPNSFAQAFTTTEFRVESTVYETGIGDWVFTSDPNEFYYWFQFGWGAGYAGSEIIHARFDGNQMLNLDGAGFSYNDYDRFRRDSLDTPIFLDVASKRLIAKRVLVNSENLQEILYIFPEGQEIYAVDWNRNLAASKKAIYDLNTFRTILAFDGFTPDQVYFAPDSTLYLLSNSNNMLYSLNLAQ